MALHLGAARREAGIPLASQGDFGIPPMHEMETAMKQQQDSKRKPEQDNPQSGQAGQRPRDLERDDSGTASQGGRQSPDSPDREGESRDDRSGGQVSPSARQPDDAAQEQDDFGGIGKQDQGSQKQRSQDPSRSR